MSLQPNDDVVAAIRAAPDLDALAELFGVDSTHEAYFRGKEAWEAALARRQRDTPVPSGLPGETVLVNDQTFHIHGVTHAGTPEERSYLRRHVEEFRDGGAAVYCEQGIRSLYFEDKDGVCEMDDYRWAMQKCASLEAESHLDRLPQTVDHLFDDVVSVASAFREAAFSLIDSGSAIYGDRFERTLGDIAAAFVTDHADLAVGESYEAFSLSQAASRNPERLVDLQRYYERTFLPQPLEREWLRGHDAELEIVTHARNERMADYVRYHNDGTGDVHLVVGAAHQPGVAYYLDQFNEGRELPEQLELF